MRSGPGSQAGVTKCVRELMRHGSAERPWIAVLQFSRRLRTQPALEPNEGKTAAVEACGAPVASRGTDQGVDANVWLRGSEEHERIAYRAFDARTPRTARHKLLDTPPMPIDHRNRCIEAMGLVEEAQAR